MKYRNIIFDFGNVLADWNPRAIALKFSQNEAECEMIEAAVFKNWAILDTGDITFNQFRADAIDKLPPKLHKTTNALLDTWHQHIPYVEGMQRLIPKLKEKGYRLYLLSNAPAMLKDHLTNFDVMSYFDGAVISGDIKLIKPDKRIYQYILNKYSLKADECLFIDDLPHNVNAARESGIDSIQFKGDVSQLEELLLPSYILSNRQS